MDTTITESREQLERVAVDARGPFGLRLGRATVLGRLENHPPAPKTFTELQKEKYQLLYHASRSTIEYGDYPSWTQWEVPLMMSLDEDCDRL